MALRKRPERKRPDLLGTLHLTVTEWTAETTPPDGIVGHHVVHDDGALTEPAAACAECRALFERVPR